ncbi:unnamed protein product, partial [Discosporangium mesarthrocarpum]
RVGDIVERDIDGIWFPAKVVAVHQAGRSQAGRQTFDLIYLDDGNREDEVPYVDVRVVKDVRDFVEMDSQPGQRGWGTGLKTSNTIKEQPKSLEEEQFTVCGKNCAKETRNNFDDADGEPKVTVHTSSRSFGTLEGEDGSATAYIINGPETNVATGSGLRGIRWLRGP